MSEPKFIEWLVRLILVPFKPWSGINWISKFIILKNDYFQFWFLYKSDRLKENNVKMIRIKHFFFARKTTISIPDY